MKNFSLLSEKHQEALARVVTAIKAEAAAGKERIEAQRDLVRVRHELKDEEQKILLEVENEVKTI